jgi:opacity protein-like surface antigen
MKHGLLLCVGFSLVAAFSNAEGSTFDSSLDFDATSRIAVMDGSSGWYFAPHVGLNLISNTATDGVTIEFSNGLALGGGVGFELQGDLAFQFDFGYIRNDIEGFINDGTGASTSPDVEYTQIPLIASFIWSASSQPDLKPYFVFGAGAIRGKYDSNAFVDSSAEWALAVKFGVGAKFDLSTTSSVSIGYQFMYANYDDAIDNHTLRLGLAFEF